MKEFYYPKYYKWLSIASMLLFGSLSLAGIGSVIFDNKNNINQLSIFIPISLFLMVFAYIGYEFFRRCCDIITVDDSAIHRFNKNNLKNVYWSDIYSIRERSLSQRMDLLDKFGNTLLKLDYQLIEFDSLCEIILSKVRHEKNANFKKAFVSSWLIRGIFIISATLFSCGIIGSYISGQFKAMWYFVGFVLFSIFGYLWEVKRITINEKSITIKTFFKRKIINFRDINNIILKNDKDGKGNLISTVFLVFSHKKPLKIAGMHEGIFIVYESIKAAWEKDRKRKICHIQLHDKGKTL
jgi:hypothetical protein